MHSVIGQGKVDALLSSTPEARRAMVEEAAGLGRFKKRRERAQAKLEKTRQNLVRVADIEREVKSALRPLRQQAAAAGRFAEAKEEWALAKGRYLLGSSRDREGSGRRHRGRTEGPRAEEGGHRGPADRVASGPGRRGGSFRRRAAGAGAHRGRVPPAGGRGRAGPGESGRLEAAGGPHRGRSRPGPQAPGSRQGRRRVPGAASDRGRGPNR